MRHNIGTAGPMWVLRPPYIIYMYIFTQNGIMSHTNTGWWSALSYICTHLMVYTAQMEINKATHEKKKKKKKWEKHCHVQLSTAAASAKINTDCTRRKIKKKYREKVQEPITWWSSLLLQITPHKHISIIKKKQKQQMYTLKCQSIFYKEGGDEKKEMWHTSTTPGSQ